MDGIAQSATVIVACIVPIHDSCESAPPGVVTFRAQAPGVVIAEDDIAAPVSEVGDSRFVIFHFLKALHGVDITIIDEVACSFQSSAVEGETETDKSYFLLHQLSYFDDELGEEVSYAPITMTAYPKEQVREFLLYHIVKGLYTHTNLPAEPTWYPTCASADTAMVNMYILKDRNPNITFNNFDGHYKSEIKPRTSNLFSSDGSYIHVVASWVDRPTRQQLNIK